MRSLARRGGEEASLALHPWHDVELPDDLTGAIPAVIEIAKGSRVKYEVDKRSGLLMVDRILFSAVHYPANYGFVPRTYCGDGDALDILVFCQEPIQGLAMMRAKVIGVMKMRDDKGVDDKLIAVHADDPEYAPYEELRQLPPHRLRELKRFFEDYKVLEHKTVEVSNPLGRREAQRVLRDAVNLYVEERENLLQTYSTRPPVPPRRRATIPGRPRSAAPRRRAPARGRRPAPR
jgi:inorganic pyrophosphatase